MYCFIVNRTSGHGRGGRVWKKIEAKLNEERVPYQVYFTEKPGHATNIVHQLMAEYERKIREKAMKDKHVKIEGIIAVGGDGTIQEVVNGLINYSIPFGCIPAGSGNDFLRGLLGKTKVELALEHILKQGSKSRNTHRKIDIVRIGRRTCLTVVGIGFDGQIAKTANESKLKKWLNQLKLGRLCYIFSLLRVLGSYVPADVQLTIDGKAYQFSNVWLIAVANMPFYGGGMAICPQAKYNDGHLDVCVVHNHSRWQLLRLLPLVFCGRHVSKPGIDFYYGKKIEVTSASPLVVHGDGEIVGETPIQVTVHPDTLQVLQGS